MPLSLIELTYLGYFLLMKFIEIYKKMDTGVLLRNSR